MPKQNGNYLDLTALLQAERDGRLIEELEQQRKTCGSSGIRVETYCHEILKMRTEAKPTGLSVDDVKRKVFHSNF